MSDLLVQILGWISEEESTKKSERVKNAVRRVEGKKTAGIVKFAIEQSL